MSDTPHRDAPSVQPDAPSPEHGGHGGHGGHAGTQPAGDSSSHRAPQRSPQRARLQRLVRRGAAPLAAAVAFALGLWIGMPAGDQAAPAPEDNHEHAAAAEDTVWTCSMHPQIRSDEPGQCPICGMDLIPVAQDDSGGAQDDPTRITLSERAKILARVRTAPVERRAGADRALHLLGRMDYDETRIRTVTAWAAGRLDRLRVATTGQHIRAGQPIADLYSPEIYSAHQDLLLALRQVERLREGSAVSEVARATAEATLASARQRLRLLGMSEATIAGMEKAKQPAQSVPVRAPFAGTVIERLVSEGNYVSAGSGIYRVADLSRLWVQLDAYERDLPGLRVGTDVSLRVSALPGETHAGRVAFVDPVIDPRTRTARVRVEVANPDGRLKPGMFAEAEVGGSGGAGKAGPGKAGAGQRDDTLVVPDTAPLFTGRRSIVYVAVPETDRPTYEAREVKLGARAGQVYPVLAGLAEGEQVVVHGAFVLDADLQIRGGLSMMARGDDTTPGAFARALTVPEGFREALVPVARSYLAVQESLAQDDAAAAGRAARDLVQTLDAAKQRARKLPEDVAGAWQALAPGLREHAQAAAGGADIEATRAAFEPLSEQMVVLLERFGNPLDASLRVAFCPMAADGKGARWVQQDDEVRNSYYGASMHTCGEIRTTVESGQHLPGRATKTQDTPAVVPGGGHSH